MGLIVLDLSGVVNSQPNDAADIVAAYNAITTQANGNLNGANLNLGASFGPFTNAVIFNAAVAKIKGAGAGIVSLQNANTANSRIVTYPDWGSAYSLVALEASQQGLYNIAFAQGADSSQLKITGTNGAALGAGNVGYVRIRSSTAGTYRTFAVTADVTIDLTGAHWGLDTKGDITGAILRVYAIDDNGTLRWGVGYQGGFYYIRNTQDDTIATNINLPEEILVNSGVVTDNSPILNVGWILANFTDASNEWAITEYHPNESADGIWQPWKVIWTGFSTVPTEISARWTQVGATVFINLIRNANGTSNATTVTMAMPIKFEVATSFNSAIIIDNGVAAHGRGDATAASTTLTWYRDINASAWTASGAKTVLLTFASYQAYQP